MRFGWQGGKSRNGRPLRGTLALVLAIGVAAPADAFESLRVRVQGGDQGLADTLGASSLLVEAWNTGIRDPNDVLAAARADYARIVGALYSEGRFGGTVSIRLDGREVADIDPLATLGKIGAVEVIVRPGPLYRFSTTEIRPLARGTELPDAFVPGEVARTGIVEDAALAAIEGWRDVGMAKAEITRESVTANHADDTLAVRIGIDRGPRLRFGELIVRGETTVSERRVRKIAGFPNREIYNPGDLERSARRLRQTGVFRTVTLNEANRPNPDGTLDVVARVADQKPRRFGFGAEIESAEGVQLSAFWLHRNLRGEGERLRIDAEISGIGGESGGTDYSLGFELGRPATPDARTDAFLAGSLEHLDEPEFTSDTFSLGIGFRREVNDEVTARAGLEYGFSNVTDASGTTKYRQVFLPLGGTLDKRENVLNTNDGYFLDIGLSPFVGIGGSESGARLTFDARAFEDYGRDSRVVLAARVQAGSIFGASITGLPNELRFTSGGSSTVRGQDYQSLDLDLGGGLRSGGRSILGLQAEVRTKITDDFSVVGFYDWATISADSLPGSGGESHAGAGLGVRYDTGIGPIRLDVGIPVSGPGNPSGFQIYIGIGQAF